MIHTTQIPQIHQVVRRSRYHDSLFKNSPGDGDCKDPGPIPGPDDW